MAMAFASPPSLQLKPPPASSLGQHPSLSAALGNMSLKSLGSGISRGMCLLEVVAPKRLKLNHQRSCNGNPVISTQQMPPFPQTPGTKCFSSKGWLKFWFFLRAGWSLRTQVSCLDSHSMEREREGGRDPKVLNQVFFSYLSVEYPTKLLSASLYWTKTMFSFIYLDMLGLPKLAESLQRLFPIMSINSWISWNPIYVYS